MIVRDNVVILLWEALEARAEEFVEVDYGWGGDGMTDMFEATNRIFSEIVADINKDLDMPLTYAEKNFAIGQFEFMDLKDYKAKLAYKEAKILANIPPPMHRKGVKSIELKVAEAERIEEELKLAEELKKPPEELPLEEPIVP